MAKREPTHVSYSELDTARGCLAKWGFRYAEGLRPVVEPDILIRGRCAHRGFEAGYGQWHTNDPKAIIATARGAAAVAFKEHIEARDLSNLPEEQARAIVDRDEETFALDRWVVEHHFESCFEAGDLEHQVPVLIEHRFEVPILNRAGRAAGLYLRGDLDLVMWDRRYHALVLDEHKTTGQGVDSIDRRLEMDPQTAGYVFALRQLLRSGVLAPGLWKAGVEASDPPTGLIRYNVSRRKVPSTPGVNKDGTVSTAACDTTPDLFAAALAEQDERFQRGEAPDWLFKARRVVLDRQEAGESVTQAMHDRLEKAEARWSELKAKQGELFARLDTQADPFWQRYEYHRTDEEIERWREEAWIDTHRIRRALRDPKLRTRNTGECRFRGCEYYDVCLRPDDGTIREAQFTSREQRAAGADDGAPKEDTTNETQDAFGF